MDLRVRVVAAYFAGDGSYEEIAERFGVGLATVSRWLRRARETGSPAPRPHGGGHWTVFDEAGLEALEALVSEVPDATSYELLDAWHARGGASTSRSALQRALKKLGYTVKKSRSPSRKRTPSASRGSGNSSSSPCKA